MVYAYGICSKGETAYFAQKNIDINVNSFSESY